MIEVFHQIIEGVCDPLLYENKRSNRAHKNVKHRATNVLRKNPIISQSYKMRQRTPNRPPPPPSMDVFSTFPSQMCIAPYWNFPSPNTSSST